MPIPRQSVAASRKARRKRLAALNLKHFLMERQCDRRVPALDNAHAAKAICWRTTCASMRASRILHPGCAVHGSDNEWEDAPYGYMGWLGKLARKLLIRSRGVYKCMVGLNESNAVASSVIADYLARHGR